MFGFLSKYLFYQLFAVFICVFLLFLPIVFSIDLFLHGVFDPLQSLQKIPFRYGQIIGIFSFLSSYIGAKIILYKYGEWIFISLKYKKKYLLFSIFYLAVMVSSVFYLIIVPTNDIVFDYKSYVSKWAVVQDNNSAKFIYKDDDHYDIWEIDKSFKLKNYKEKFEKVILTDDDFYVVWNETKKMSLKRLKEYKEYADKNKFSADDYYKQKHVYYSRFFVIFVMILSGIWLAWRKSFYGFIFCFLFFSWLDLLAFFLPLKYCILVTWTNIFLWLLIGLYYILI